MFIFLFQCNEYHKKEISGDICYSLCHEKSFELKHCIDNDPYIKRFGLYSQPFHTGHIQINSETCLFQTFLIQDNLVVRVPVSVLHPETDIKLPHGLTVEQFSDLGRNYFNSILGYSHHQDLINRLLQFADFNGNQELSLGEVQSVWRLINNREFLLLFLFHKQSSVPNINGTCGSLYRFEYHPKNYLYHSNKSGFLSAIFTNSYRWGFPSLHKRLKIAVGLLELVIDLSETEGFPFFLCNIDSNLFGYTEKYELLLQNMSELKSAQMLKNIFANRTCVSDGDCQYSSQCRSLCDNATRKCSSQILNTPLYYVCDILREYILIGETGHYYYDLKHYLEKCIQVSPNMVEFSAYMNEFHAFLWDFIKNDAK
ncbi:hypothetical protein LOTGIDRAFT_140273 [Lottia gigantea]|uniref:FAM69 N-terminal domain-containing protein n=1 Tax=Lottia gigantea TaxID=225164 RepID=V4CFV3_LOTGI|nr:hypothetical protein LOTGIDRAFT_140273 [Lottia gigantea]ESP00915.1 hypothetical protein LOTGIDRAFT_140273 [Lottia gigantea]